MSVVDEDAGASSLPVMPALPADGPQYPSAAGVANSSTESMDEAGLDQPDPTGMTSNSMDGPPAGSSALPQANDSSGASGTAGAAAANGGGPKTGYKTVLCQFYLQGTCEKADQCLYAHGTSQLRNSAGLEIKDVQSKTKTKLCAKFLQYGSCPFGPQCTYAHGVSELQKVLQAAPNQANAQSHAYFKTELCKMFMSGMYCSYENECQFAHGKHELRPKPKIDPKTIKPEERLKMAEKNKRSPFYKTRPCEGFRQTGKCDFDDICNFAHGEAELRPMPDMTETGFPSPAEKRALQSPTYKTSMCKNVPNCQFGDSCKFAHSPMEMMRAQGRPGGMGGPMPPGNMGGPPGGDFFKVSMCKNMEQGECQFGPTCRYAHHPSELRPNPKYKTSMCHSMMNQGHCERGDECKYAHDRSELQSEYGAYGGVASGPTPHMGMPPRPPGPPADPSHTSNYKTVMCREKSSMGTCPRGASCHFAHSPMELRRPLDAAAVSGHPAAGSMPPYGSMPRPGPPPRPGAFPPHPNPRYKTSLCQNYMATGNCERQGACIFAHGPADLRPPQPRGVGPTSGPMGPRPGGPLGPMGPRPPPQYPVVLPHGGGNRYKTAMCKFIPNCQNGANCVYAHSPEELSRPTGGPPYGGGAGGDAYNGGVPAMKRRAIGGERTKTALCTNFARDNFCKFGNQCSFAHGVHELQDQGNKRQRVM